MPLRRLFFTAILLAIGPGAILALGQPPAADSPSTQPAQARDPSGYPLTRKQLDELMRQAETASHDQRLAALEELCLHQLALPVVAGRMRKMLDDPAADIAQGAAHALSRMRGAGIPQLLDALKSRDGYTRRLAVTALADPYLNAYGTRETLVREVAHLRDDRDPLLRRAADTTLCALLPRTDPVLIRAMKGENLVKLAAADQLLARRLNDTPQPSLVPSGYYLTQARLDELILQAETGTHDQQLTALWEIARDELSMPDVARRVRKLLDDPAADIAQAAADALGTMRGAAIPQFLDAMQSRDGFTRRLAVTALADPYLNVYRNKETLVKEIANTLDDPDPLLRRAAVGTLCALLPQSEPILLRALKDDDAAKMTAIKQLLAKRGGDVPLAAVDLLAHQLNDHDPRIRRAVAATLCAIWPQSEPILTFTMKGGDDAVRMVVVDQLIANAGQRSSSSAAGSRPGATPSIDERFADFDAQVTGELLRRMKSNDPVEAERAFEATRALRSSKSRNQLVATLIHALENEGATTSRDKTLRKLALLEKELMPAWIDGAKSKDANTRGFCVRVLANETHSKTDKSMIAAMTVALRDPDYMVRYLAINWAGSLPEPPPGAVETLAGWITPGNNLYDGAPQDRYWAAELLGGWMADSKTSVPALTAALDDPHAQIAAVLALRKFGADARSAVPRLAALLKAQKFELSEFSRAIAQTLIELGPDGPPAAVGYLIDVLHLAADAPTRLWAVHNLKASGRDAAAAAPVLTAMLADSPRELRIEVARALGGIGPPANAALAPLSRMVDNINPDVRQAASEALLKIAPTGKGLGPALMAAVLNRDRVCAESLASALQRSGQTRTYVVRLTNLASDDPDTVVRATAHRAIEVLSRR